MKRILLAVVSLLVVAALAVLGAVGWVGSERALHPTPSTPEHTLAEFDFPVEDVRFPSRDGTRLAGWLVKGTRPETIIVVHGFRGSKQSVLEHIDLLHRAGFNVFAIDLRNSGESAGSITTFGYFERYDVAGAADYLLSRSDLANGPIGALGISMGSAAVLLGATDTDSIRAIVSEGGYESIESVVAVGFEHFLKLPPFPFAPITVKIAELRAGIDASRIRPIEAVPHLAPRPILFIVGSASTEIRPQDSVNMYEAARGPRELWMIQGGKHGNGIDVTPEEYARRVVGFFETSLGAAAQCQVAATGC